MTNAAKRIRARRRRNPKHKDRIYSPKLALKPFVPAREDEGNPFEKSSVIYEALLSIAELPNPPESTISGSGKASAREIAMIARADMIEKIYEAIVIGQKTLRIFGKTY